MPSYRYQHGDRPLDGFTIEHALGRGGFGEVYYAVSDSGRQVALKAVQNYEDIELRGISHCMNLKSPHLVSIFDVKHNDRNDPFVIMEYVAGPSLRELLDESPEGIGAEKAAWFVREIGKGLALLHDAGVVHRDLKPHNVFVEDGYVKVGDYSLSKVITASHRSGHTLTVGTVHYMAPEISLGRYDRTVDIYALGVMLHEMLTGRPPFTGETMGEVLMKHMAGDVDVSDIEEPYASVVAKALARNPEDRYQSVDEMVEALFGVEHVQNSVSTFNPQSLTVMAERAARVGEVNRAAAPASRKRTTPKATPVQPAAARARIRPDRKADDHDGLLEVDTPDTSMRNLGRFVAQFGNALALRRFASKSRRIRSLDPMPARLRFFLTGAVICLASFFVSMMYAESHRHSFRPFDDDTALAMFMMAVLTFGPAATVRWITPRLAGLPSLVHRLAFALVPFLPALILADAFGPRPNDAAVALCSLVPLLVQDWRWMTAPMRPQRIALTPSVMSLAIAAFAAIVMCPREVGLITGVVAVSSLAVQLLCPFDPVGARKLANTTAWGTSFGISPELWHGWNFPDETAPAKNSEDVPPVAVADVDIDAGPATDETVTGIVEAASTSTIAMAGGTGNDQQADPADDGRTPYRRTAMLLSLIPICGLHRFYVGRTRTGILWLLTFGLASVGQLVDIIMIALGGFRDVNGRHLIARRQGVSLSSEQVNPLSVVPGPESLVHAGSRSVGALMMAVTVTLGFALAIDVPSMVAANVFDGFVSARDVDDVLGMTNWSGLLNRLGSGIACLLGLFAVTLLMLSRRQAGLVHLLRVPVGAAGLCGAFAILSTGSRSIDWTAFASAVHHEQLGPAVAAILDARDFLPLSILSAVAVVVSLVILEYPPKQQRLTAFDATVTRSAEEAESTSPENVDAVV